MDTPGTTTWYAFEDPKTGREYFHEPVSGDTSWVLPTTSSRATHRERAARGGNVSNSTANRAAKNEKGANDSKKQGDGWSSVAIAIVSILLFNTLFLLVLVRSLYAGNGELKQMLDNNKPPSGGVDVDTTIQPHAKMPKLANDMHQSMQADAESGPESTNLGGANDTVSNEGEDDDAKGAVEECHETSGASGSEVSGTGPTAQEDTASFNPPEESSGVEKNATEANEVKNPAGTDAIEWPGVCGIPFSYIFVGQCRRRARAKLPMPLMDAEKAVWI